MADPVFDTICLLHYHQGLSLPHGQAQQGGHGFALVADRRLRTYPMLNLVHAEFSRESRFTFGTQILPARRVRSASVPG